MTTGGKIDEDDLDTPADLGIRRNSSNEAKAIADLALSVAALAVDIGATARRIDTLEGPERAGLLAGLARQLAEAGDAMHDARRVITDL